MSRILVIDDDPSVRHVVVAVLVHAGHTVVQAKDGREGLNLFRIEPTDLVVTDLVMPHYEGIEAITVLRREYPDIPIIAMSGTALHSPLYLDLAAKLGASRTLAKPFPPEALLRLVDELLPPPA